MRSGDGRKKFPSSSKNAAINSVDLVMPRSAGALTASLLASGTSVPDVFEHVLAQCLGLEVTSTPQRQNPDTKPWTEKVSYK